MTDLNTVDVAEGRRLLAEVTEDMLNAGQERAAEISSRSHFDDHREAEIYLAMRQHDPLISRLERLERDSHPPIDLTTSIEVILTGWGFSPPGAANAHALLTSAEQHNALVASLAPDPDIKPPFDFISLANACMYASSGSVLGRAEGNAKWFRRLSSAFADAFAIQAERDALKAEEEANAPFLAAAKHEQENICDLRVELSIICSERDRAVEALRELHAAVQGECPSLLDEDSGGSAKLGMEIEEILAKLRGEAHG